MAMKMSFGFRRRRISSTISRVAAVEELDARRGVGDDPRGDAVHRLLARGVDRRDDRHVGDAQRLAELAREVARARVEMRLEERHDAAVRDSRRAPRRAWRGSRSDDARSRRRRSRRGSRRGSGSGGRRRGTSRSAAAIVSPVDAELRGRRRSPPARCARCARRARTSLKKPTPGTSNDVPRSWNARFIARRSAPLGQAVADDRSLLRACREQIRDHADRRRSR